MVFCYAKMSKVVVFMFTNGHCNVLVMRSHLIYYSSM